MEHENSNLKKEVADHKGPQANVEAQHSEYASEHIKPSTEKKLRKTLVTNCDHSKYRVRITDTEQKVLETLKTFDYPVTPKVLAFHSKIKHSSIRKVLKRLVDKGLVTKAYYGHYTQRVTKEGVGCFEAPRVHRLQLRVVGFGCGLGSVVLTDNGLYKVTLVRYANCCMVHIDCKKDFSFEFGALVAVVELVKSYLGGPKDCDIEVVAPEFNNDYHGLQIYGSKSVSFSDFKGNFERIYQKGGFVRSEARVNGTYPLEQVYALLKGGMPAYQILQSVGFLSEKLDKLVEAMKFHNEVDSRIAEYLKALLDKDGEVHG